MDGVGEELTAVALQSPSRGTATVDLPPGVDTVVAEPWSGLVGTVARTAEVTRVGVPLQAMQSATVVAWGPAGRAPLEVAATFADDALEVELASRADVPLTDVEVTRIRRGAKIDNLVMVAHGCDVGEFVFLAAQTGISGSTRIGSGAQGSPIWTSPATHGSASTARGY